MPRKRSARIGKVTRTSWLQVPDIGRVEFTIPTSEEDNPLTNVFDYPDIPEVARDLARVWCGSIEVKKPAYTTAKRCQEALRKFLEFASDSLEMNQRDRLIDLSADEFELWESHLDEKYPEPSGFGHAQAAIVLAILRKSSERQLLSDSLADRSQYGPIIEYREAGVTDAYADNEVDELREVARNELDAALARLEAGRGQAMEAASRESLAQVRSQAEAGRYLLDNGPIGTKEWRTSGMERFDRTASHESIFASTKDLAAASVAFVLETGLERGCLVGLKVDDIKYVNGKISRLHYRKPRAGAKVEKEIPITDGERGSSGEILKSILEMSGAYRRFSSRPEFLFQQVDLSSTRSGLARPGPFEKNRLRIQLIQLGKRAGLDDSLTFQRMRKSQKGTRYVATRGRLQDFALNHSIEVAGQHYANIPALRPFHDDAIEAGLTKAFRNALKAAESPVVVPDSDQVDQEPGLRSDEATPVWLSTCTNVNDSPFAKSGEACPVPLTGCLHCRNALITEDNLPAILAVRSELMDRSEELRLEEWVDEYGVAFVRTGQILDQFSDSQIERAREVEANLFVSPLEKLRRG